MRLKSLAIPKFKNLRDFELSFAESMTTVLVGHNGAGKSNVLEALIIIFRDLDIASTPTLAYRLSYECRGSTVDIDCDPTRSSPAVKIEVDGVRWSADRFSRRGGGEYLPEFVFGYYSGPSNRMEEHFELHQSRFAAELLAGRDRPLRPLLYARQVHSQFVLLSFFAQPGPLSDILVRFLNVTGLDSVMFVLKKPAWYNARRTSSDDKSADRRFWGARGVVGSFLQRIFDLALAPVYISKPQENLVLYLKSVEDLQRLASEYSSQTDFFKALESLYISDLVEDVRTRVRMADEQGVLTFRELSEGEQQLLTVMGLLRFIEGSEGLILLDEPDTHLNPAWSLEYTRLLRAHVQSEESTQVVMATHDPLVVAGLARGEVRRMRRGRDGQIVAEMPDTDPKGMGVAGLLTSELYGLRSQLDLDTLGLLDRKRDLSSANKLTKEQLAELRRLNEALQSLDFNRVTRDPLYKPYVDAMSALEPELGLRSAMLSSEQIDERSELAEAVVRELLRRLGDGE